jgi:pyridoxamine 5'-phosphate oxidase
VPLPDDAPLDDPLAQFHAWWDEAVAGGVAVPEAVALATATPDGRPSVRMVLVKRADELGLGFHTGYGSRKAGELDTNPHAALAFHWAEVGRQVRVEGRVERTSREDSEAYFRTRPRGSQLAVWASRQGAELGSRDELDAAYAEAERRFADGDVPLPDGWGGYRLVPDAWEFWQHGEHRLHDRFRYTRAGAGWRRVRLSP